MPGAAEVAGSAPSVWSPAAARNQSRNQGTIARQRTRDVPSAVRRARPTASRPAMGTIIVVLVSLTSTACAPATGP